MSRRRPRLVDQTIRQPFTWPTPQAVSTSSRGERRVQCAESWNVEDIPPVVFMLQGHLFLLRSRPFTLARRCSSRSLRLEGRLEASHTHMSYSTPSSRMSSSSSMTLQLKSSQFL